MCYGRKIYFFCMTIKNTTGDRNHIQIAKKKKSLDFTFNYVIKQFACSEHLLLLKRIFFSFLHNFFNIKMGCQEIHYLLSNYIEHIFVYMCGTGLKFLFNLMKIIDKIIGIFLHIPFLIFYKKLLNDKLQLYI